MITKLNLSSNPFRNRTLPYLLALLLLGCTLAGAVLTFTQWREIAAKNKLAKQNIEDIEKDLAEEKAKVEKVKQSLSPDQARLMIAGHKVVANKEFGWSRLLSDIERVLPGSVSASRINVENVYKENGRIVAEIEFSVLSRNYQGVQQLIERMNNSGVFRPSLRSQDLQKGETITYSEYTLGLIYRPSAGISLNPQIDSETALNNSTAGGNE